MNNSHTSIHEFFLTYGERVVWRLERTHVMLVASFAACSILRALTQWGATLVIYRGENADVSGGLRADCGSARRARPLQSEPQLMSSGNYPARPAWRSERLREHARGEPTRSGRVAGRGHVGKRAARRQRAPCVEPKRRGTTRPLA